MSTVILLVRHGQIKSNVTGFYSGWANEDLDEVGYIQAHSLSSRLASLPIAAIYSSPLKRTHITATILAKPHGLQVETSDELIEIRLGDWEGLHMDEIRQRWPELWQQYRIDPSRITLPNGESFKQVTERAVRFFEKVAATNRSKHAIIVTHDAIIRVLIAHVLGVLNSIYRRFDVNNASLSAVRVIDGKARLITLNDISHL